MKILICLVCVLMLPTAYADFDSQFDNVLSVQTDREAKQEADALELAKKQALASAELKRKNEADAKARAERLAKATAEKKAEDDEIKLEAYADKARIQSYEDRVMELKLRSMEAEVSTEEKVAGRANEYIDRELQSQDASNDVVQSVADRNRKEGDASVIQADKDITVNIVK